MSTYGFSSAELGLSFRSQQERPFLLSYNDILDDKVPVDEIRMHMVSAEAVLRMLEEVKLHLFMKVENIASMGIYSEAEIQKMYQRTDEAIKDYEQLDLTTMDESALMDLIQKARSAHKELQELHSGNRTLLDRIALSERINSYIYPGDNLSD